MATKETVNSIITNSDYLSKYLKNAPEWLFDSLMLVKKPKDTVIVEENAKGDTIYFLVDGVVKAMDYRIKGIAYDYMWFYPVEVFGAMEVFFERDNYMTTLKTVTDCTFLVLTREQFKRWIWTDTNALQMAVSALGKSLLDQNRVGRLFLFLQGTDRIIYMLSLQYESFGKGKTMVVRSSRQELSERSGLSIKTVNRAVKKMEDDGFILREGHKIIINKSQYKRMKAYLESIVDM